ncbi:glycosyltransferase family 2 protein [Aliivibrio sifiae]|uniref:glycosyltransferase family 2 protein n=1 Tax=Aliivibrio sifiae TaxID=566293 RepID=UPI003D0D13AE
MKVSFVVIGLNEGYALTRCLKSIYVAISNSLKITEYEVIYIDSGSDDNSVDLVSDFNTVIVYSLTGDRSAAAARKVGELNSSLDYILFLDGDMELDDAFLDSVLGEDVLSEAVVGCIGLRKEYSVIRDSNELLTDNYYQQRGTSVLKHIGGALFIRRSALVDCGGWVPEQRLWEESLLLCKVNGRGEDIVGIEKPFISHFNAKKTSIFTSLRSYCRLYGTGYYYINFFLNSIKTGHFKVFLKNQQCFCFFIFASLIVLPCLLLIGEAKYYLLVILLLSIKFSIKSVLHSSLRCIWLLIFPFIKHKKFTFKWKAMVSVK